jgi:hypothetical protein
MRLQSKPNRLAEATMLIYDEDQLPPVGGRFCVDFELLNEVQCSKLSEFLNGMAEVDRPVEMFWDDGIWYSGKVVDYNMSNAQHLIIYEEGTEEWANLSDEKIIWRHKNVHKKRKRKNSEGEPSISPKLLGSPRSSVAAHPCVSEVRAWAQCRDEGRAQMPSRPDLEATTVVFVRARLGDKFVGPELAHQVGKGLQTFSSTSEAWEAGTLVSVQGDSGSVRRENGEVQSIDFSATRVRWMLT